MVGIYKILSPSGKVYIGQSWNITKRWNRYKEKNCSKQRKLFYSFEKYGLVNHKKEVIHELPKDISQEVMNNYEILYLDLYKSCGVELLNIKEGGSSGKHSEETILKMRNNDSNTRFKKGQMATNLGKKATEESKKRMSESAKKRGDCRPIGYKHSKEVVERIASKNRGKPPWNKGKELSPEHRSKLSAAKSNGKCHRATKVLCTLTKTVYGSIAIAARAIGMKETTLYSQLRGKNKNKTQLKLWQIM